MSLVGIPGWDSRLCSEHLKLPEFCLGWITAVQSWSDWGGSGPAIEVRVRLPNRMNFRKSGRGGGGGSFSIQKFILQILDLYIGLFRTFWEKKLWYNCQRGQKPFGIFPDSSNLVAGPFPKELIAHLQMIFLLFIGFLYWLPTECQCAAVHL